MATPFAILLCFMMVSNNLIENVVISVAELPRGFYLHPIGLSLSLG